jgi:hypothetical protein
MRLCRPPESQSLNVQCVRLCEAWQFLLTVTLRKHTWLTAFVGGQFALPPTHCVLRTSESECLQHSLAQLLAHQPGGLRASSCSQLLRTRCSARIRVVAYTGPGRKGA